MAAAGAPGRRPRATAPTSPRSAGRPPGRPPTPARGASSITGPARTHFQAPCPVSQRRGPRGDARATAHDTRRFRPTGREDRAHPRPALPGRAGCEAPPHPRQRPLAGLPPTSPQLTGGGARPLEGKSRVLALRPKATSPAEMAATPSTTTNTATTLSAPPPPTPWTGKRPWPICANTGEPNPHRLRCREPRQVLTHRGKKRSDARGILWAVAKSCSNKAYWRYCETQVCWPIRPRGKLQCYWSTRSKSSKSY